MFLSRGVWLSIVFLLISFGTPVPSAQADVALGSGKAQVDYDWVDALERRIERLLPNLLTSLSEVRREREPVLVRCFDRAVSALNSVAKQVAFHADHLEDESAAERARHQKALVLLNARVDEIATRRIGCFTDGAVTVPGETRVEVVYSAR